MTLKKKQNDFFHLESWLLPLVQAVLHALHDLVGLGFAQGVVGEGLPDLLNDLCRGVARTSLGDGVVVTILKFLILHSCSK